MAIIFQKIKWKNLLSTGDQWTEIDLLASKTSLIIGANGSGKSTLLDALSYSLFGKAHRKINKPSLINSINNKHCLVEIEFMVGTIKYKIVRGMKPQIFEIHQNGQIINQEAHALDYQKILESNILKMNHKSFHQIVVLGSGNYVPFMELSTQNRRSVIEDLLDINVFSRMNSILKEKMISERNELKSVANEIKLLKEKIRLQSKHIDELKEIDASAIDEINEELEELDNDSKRITIRNNEILKIVEADTSLTRASEVSKKNRLLRSHESSIAGKITKYRKSESFYTENSCCPTCDQSIMEAHKTTMINKFQDDVESLEVGLVKLREELVRSEKLQTSISEEVGKLSFLNTELAGNNIKVSHLNETISKLTRKLIKPSDSDTSDAEKNLKADHEDLNKNTEISRDLAINSSYNGVIEELLKDTGIKSKIIKQYLPVMNKVINHYLQILDFFVMFTLDESFNETIRSRHRDEFTYGSFSEGEKSKINISLMLAWRQVARMKNSVACNLLIMDEVFDSSMDSDSVDNLQKIISSLRDDTNTFIISHKHELRDAPLFARILEFKKPKNFSELHHIEINS